MTSMENFCEQVWFSRDKDCAKIMLKTKMTRMTVYERSLLNHVVVSEDIVEYEKGIRIIHLDLPLGVKKEEIPSLIPAMAEDFKNKIKNHENTI